jgi:hypothetical protein
MRGVEDINDGLEVFQQLMKLTVGKVSSPERIIEALEKAANLSSLTLDDSNLPFETLIQVKDLTLESCFDFQFASTLQSFAEFPSTLIQLKSLKIVNCHGLMSFPAFLPSLQNLTIEGADKLPLLQLFGEVSSPLLNMVNISRCAILKEIRITRRIDKLVIETCKGLKISGKEFVRSIKRYI